VHVPGDSRDDAVAQLAVALLVVGVRVLREVDEVIRVHVGNLAASLVWPRRWIGEGGSLREKFFDTLASALAVRVSIAFGSSHALAQPTPMMKQFSQFPGGGVPYCDFRSLKLRPVNADNRTSRFRVFSE
jgi:hypothetical protein